MSYLALYRKYRPTNFDDVVDQKHITQTLINQIVSDKIGHAYLFCGSRGTGKTTTAKIFARSINCEHPINGSPCGKCETCESLKNGANLDVLEIDAASNNGVDEIRELREQIKYPPVVGKYKVYIIDEVHMLTTSAFNALLKTLEEPPKYVVFILATTEVHKLPATILSRCMRFDFKLIATDKIAGLIEKILTDSKIKYDPKAVSVIARAGDGSVRDALSIADMVIAYSNSNLTYESVVQVVGNIEKDKLFNIVEKVLTKDLGGMLEELDKIIGEGKPALVLSKELILYFRDLLVMLTLSEEKAKDMVIVPSDIFEKMKGQAIKENYTTIISAIEGLSYVEQDLRYSVQPKIILEAALIKIMNFINLENRVALLEQKLQGDNLEVKKKISEIKQTVLQPSVDIQKDIRHNVAGKLMNFLRQKGLMLTYASVVDARNIQATEDELIIEVQKGSSSEGLTTEANKNVLSEFASRLGLKLNLIVKEDEDELLITKLKELLGNKLIIEE